MNLESNLRHALRRESPAPGFSSRVLDRIANDRPVHRNFAWGRAVAAGLMVVVLGGGWLAHHEIERRAGERARDEALLALRIASSKINRAQDEVRSITLRHND